jgi:hypothetical protein
MPEFRATCPSSDETDGTRICLTDHAKAADAGIAQKLSLPVMAPFSPGPGAMLCWPGARRGHGGHGTSNGARALRSQPSVSKDSNYPGPETADMPRALVTIRTIIKLKVILSGHGMGIISGCGSPDLGIGLAMLERTAADWNHPTTRSAAHLSMPAGAGCGLALRMVRPAGSYGFLDALEPLRAMAREARWPVRAPDRGRGRGADPA